MFGVEVIVLRGSPVAQEESNPGQVSRKWLGMFFTVFVEELVCSEGFSVMLPDHCIKNVACW